jgi:gingipain R
MKKFTLFFLALLFISLNTFAQNQQIIVGKNYVNPNEVTLVAERGISTTIKFALNELDLIEVSTDYGTANIMMSAKAPVINEVGTPELIYLPTAIIIPNVGSAELDISYGTFTDIENIEIVPSKGRLPRNIDPETVPYIKGEMYNIDAFFPGNLAELNEPFIMRDVRGQTLFVYPVQYNPVTKTLRIYSEITVTVNYNDSEGINEFTTQKRHKTIEPQFNDMYQRLFINNSVVQGRGYPTGEEGEILIICHTPWVDEMQPYIDWKRTIGRKTTIVPTSAITQPLTAANIKTYISNFYNDPDNDLAFVLFVGDSPQIPAYPASGAQSDVEYGKLAGGDHYLEILIGRMSAENAAHVQTQVQRTIHYERDLNTTDTWLSTGMGIARNEWGAGPNHPYGHDGQENDYRHIDNIRNRMLDYGYTTVYQDYDGNCPGIPNTNATIMSQHFNDGVSMTNFCNHGLQQSWSVGNYSNTEVNALQNAGKLSYIFSVACNNGEFMWYGGPCFAEAWMRATKDGQPIGAIATFMATISLDWGPTMTAQDEFANICLDLPSPYGPNQPGIKRTIAGAMLNGSQKMIMRHGNGNLADYNSWLVFGDPTLNFRTKTPEEMTISHLPNIPLGASEFTVECDADGAVAAITYKDADNEVIILGVATVVDGVAEIIFDEPLAVEGDLTLAVTGFNKVAYLTTIQVGGEIELFPPLNLTFTVEKANHVILEWEAPESKSLTVTGYNVYRDGEPITPEPIRDENRFTDIVPANGEYKYEITALYGETLESDPSDPVIVSINGMCISISETISVEQTEGENILVSWEAPEYEGTELVGYNVYRDEEQLNDEIIPADELSFLDENVETDIELCYHVEVVYNDCEETLITEKECITLIAVKEHSATERFNIYPNPASTELRITIAGQARNDGELREGIIEIFDVYGKKVLSHTANRSPQTIIDVSHLQSGSYFVKIYSESNQVAYKKLIINH